MASSKPTPKNRQQILNAKYGSPLPILLPNSSTGLQAQNYKDKGKSKSGQSILSTYAPSLTAEIIVPQCNGVYDPITRSVWVTDREDMDILFRRGFFGKGTLSRSEPSWRERRVDLLKGGSSESTFPICDAYGVGWTGRRKGSFADHKIVAYAAELARDKRRQERKQFKIDRAAAMLNAAKTAENVLVTGQAPVIPGEPSLSTLEEDAEDDQEEELKARSSSPTPSTSTTALDVSSLTPQTYLVRPTRPDANRNRGRKAFKRRPPPAQNQIQNQNQNQDQASSLTTPLPGSASASATVPILDRTAAQVTLAEEQSADVDDEVEPLPEDDLEEELVEEMEHLQLSLEEAWLLSAGLGVLKIFDPETVRPLIPILPSGSREDKEGLLTR